MEQYTLITGASSGIGRELAYLAAKDKRNLVLVARDEEVLTKVKGDIEKAYSIKVYILATDLSLLESAQGVFDFTTKNNLKIDILINDAGFGDFSLFADADWNKLQSMMQLNMITLTHLTKLYLPTMIAQKNGRVLNVASTAAFQPGPLMAVYYATKAYVLSFSEAIANELKGSGVTVTTLCPGPTASGFQKASAQEQSKIVKNKKLPTAKEVAEYGYKSMLEGKVLAVHGFKNKMLLFGTRFLSKEFITKLVRKVQDK